MLDTWDYNDKDALDWARGLSRTIEMPHSLFTEILELAGKAAETAFLDQATDPKEIAKALARVLEEIAR